MARHIVQRTVISITVLLGVLAIGFALLQLIPTDPATMLAGPTASPAEIASIRESMGLNEPLLYQFGIYILRVIQGDLGRAGPLWTIEGIRSIALAAITLGGAVVTETIFAWPGVGRLGVGAIISSDFTLAQGAILVLAISFIVVNLIVDLTYAFLDPRIRKG